MDNFVLEIKNFRNSQVDSLQKELSYAENEVKRYRREVKECDEALELLKQF